jgi:hypothetical protein
VSNFKGGWTGERNPKYKHGWANTPTYMSWRNMLSRCTNPEAKDWPLYGGRGIKVVKRWFRFENFLADMGKKPTNRTLDRRNNNGNYSPRNCRWATKRQQYSNKRPVPLSCYLRGAAHPHFGKKLSPEHLAILMASHTGIPSWNAGKKLPPEFGVKISAAKLGIKSTPEVIAARHERDVKRGARLEKICPACGGSFSTKRSENHTYCNWDCFQAFLSGKRAA